MDLFTLIIVLVYISIIFGYIYGIYRIYKDNSSFKYLITLMLIGLIVWRGYSNYSLGGLFLPPSIKEVYSWFIKNLTIIEILLWIFVFITPFYQALRRRCPKCSSASLTVIEHKLVSKDLQSRMVDVKIGEDKNGAPMYRKEKEYYEKSKFEVTYECNECLNTWIEIENTERTI